MLLLAFAALTIVAAAAMLLNNASQRSPDNPDETESGPATSGSGRTGTAVETRPDTRRGQLIATTSKVVVCGTAVGFLTGFLGVGGGCLVVPALVIVLRMPMAPAVGTSLLIIALNSISSVASRMPREDSGLGFRETGGLLLRPGGRGEGDVGSGRARWRWSARLLRTPVRPSAGVRNRARGASPPVVMRLPSLRTL
ncbi:MAG: uncharacterized protein QOF00_1255 [Pseudonocardiales bacterium]|nr:uncharacterized protein [Pseudonocardiales bacterium]